MSKKPFPWWLETGPVLCPFCENRLHFEALLYCTDCDRPVCPICLEEAPGYRSVLCPECHAAAEDLR